MGSKGTTGAPAVLALAVAWMIAGGLGCGDREAGDGPVPGGVEPEEAAGGGAAGAAAAAARAEELPPLANPEWKAYWFAGMAEISRYRLEQRRYGELREGDAVLIFVTEDFLPDAQVKSESADRRRSGAWPVMKLNRVRTFTTGIYPYSLMTSVFTPLDIDAHPRSLKMSSSAQEWCGHTYLQLNLRGDEYRAVQHSYFEGEADREVRIPAVWLEDELLTRIRLAPRRLPVGDLRVVPSGMFGRLAHRAPRAERARATLESDGATSVYSLEYVDAERTLTLRFERDFPHGITGWEESYGRDRESRATVRAVRTHSLQTDYWNRNSNADRPLRARLGLDRSDGSAEESP